MSYLITLKDKYGYFTGSVDGPDRKTIEGHEHQATEFKGKEDAERFIFAFSLAQIGAVAILAKCLYCCHLRHPGWRICNKCLNFHRIFDKDHPNHESHKVPKPVTFKAVK